MGLEPSLLDLESLVFQLMKRGIEAQPGGVGTFGAPGCRKKRIEVKTGSIIVFGVITCRKERIGTHPLNTNVTNVIKSM